MCYSTSHYKSIITLFFLFSFLKIFLKFLTDDFCDKSLELQKLFTDDPYDPTFTIMKTSKGKVAILYRECYYNHQRHNKNSTVFRFIKKR